MSLQIYQILKATITGMLVLGFIAGVGSGVILLGMTYPDAFAIILLSILGLVGSFFFGCVILASYERRKNRRYRY